MRRSRGALKGIEPRPLRCVWLIACASFIRHLAILGHASQIAPSAYDDSNRSSCKAGLFQSSGLRRPAQIIHWLSVAIALISKPSRVNFSTGPNQLPILVVELVPVSGIRVSTAAPAASIICACCRDTDHRRSNDDTGRYFCVFLIDCRFALPDVNSTPSELARYIGLIGSIVGLKVSPAERHALRFGRVLVKLLAGGSAS